MTNNLVWAGLLPSTVYNLKHGDMHLHSCIVQKHELLLMKRDFLSFSHVSVITNEDNKKDNALHLYHAFLALKPLYSSKGETLLLQCVAPSWVMHGMFGAAILHWYAFLGNSGKEPDADQGNCRERSLFSRQTEIRNVKNSMQKNSPKPKAVQYRPKVWTHLLIQWVSFLFMTIDIVDSHWRYQNYELTHVELWT